MPITYTIDQQQGLIFATWKGKITADVLARHWATIFADPDFKSVRRTLADVRGATIAFSGAELAKLVDSVAKPAVGEARWKAAIVVSQTAHFGMSHQFHVFAKMFSEDAVFFDRETALAWLLAP
jgi:hypothetical protein